MSILPLSFALLTYTGYWRPLRMSSSLKYWAYNVYSVIMILLLFTFTFCGMVDCCLVLVSKDLEIFIEKFSLFLSVLGVSCKVTNLVVRRDEIIGLTDMLLKDICLPRDSHEEDIQRRFNHSAKCVLQLLRRNILSFSYFCSVFLIFCNDL